MRDKEFICEGLPLPIVADHRVALFVSQEDGALDQWRDGSRMFSETCNYAPMSLGRQVHEPLSEAVTSPKPLELPQVCGATQQKMDWHVCRLPKEHEGMHRDGDGIHWVFDARNEPKPAHINTTAPVVLKPELQAVGGTFADGYAKCLNDIRAKRDAQPNEFGVVEGEPGTATKPLKADGTIEDIARRVKSGNWTTLDLNALASFVLQPNELAAAQASFEGLQRYKVYAYESESESTGRTWYETQRVKDPEGEYVLFEDLAAVKSRP